MSGAAGRREHLREKGTRLNLVIVDMARQAGERKRSAHGH
jgi:hypothetical protein